jgi:hypothetical protein
MSSLSITASKIHFWRLSIRALPDIMSGPDSGKFSKSGLSGNQTFSFLDTGLLTILKIEKKSKSKKKIQKKNSRFFFVYLSGLGTFDTKFVSRDLIL